MTSSMLGAKILADMVEGKHNPNAEVFAPSRSMAKKQLLVNVAETTVNFITPTTKRCSHLGCALKWNPLEHTWDCPCHGSRFDEHGGLIDNPAMKNSNV
jgi:Rieske Fe-S protein